MADATITLPISDSKFDLSKESKLHRGPVSRGLYLALPEKEGEAAKSPVDRDGGRFNAGLIRGMSVITRGEALGHGEWIDTTMLSQVAAAIKGAGKAGIKSRFAHPDLSGDGIGKMTGKAFDASVKGDQVIADWHALKSAHKTPDGDLAGYVMDLAEEAPESFGTSISFVPDYAAMRKFRDDNMVEREVVVDDGETVTKTKRRVFQSPDPLNENNLPHVFLKELIAVDVVDEPAANPAGLFHRGPFELLENGDRILEYAFGLSEDTPEISTLGIDASRLRGFVQRFCQTRGVTFSKEPKMADVNPTAPADENKPADAPKPETQLNANPPASPATPPAKPADKPADATDVAALSKQTAAEAIAEERQRCADINSLCKQAGKTELAAGFIEGGDKVEDVRAKLFTALCNERPPVGPDAAAAPESPAKPNADGNDKYRAEFKAEPAYAKSMTEAEYIAMRRVDDKLDPLENKAE